MWRLDSGARTFLPRLQGALTAISPAPSDPACYVITQADNTIRLVSNTCQRQLSAAWCFLPCGSLPWQCVCILCTLGSGELLASPSPGIALNSPEASLLMHMGVSDVSARR